jgi:hypothetical protein
MVRKATYERLRRFVIGEVKSSSRCKSSTTVFPSGSGSTDEGSVATNGGKTTLATNLAGYFASRGGCVLLLDLDRQGSASDWLARRPEALPAIHGWNIQRGKKVECPVKPDWLVMDSPAGFPVLTLLRDAQIYVQAAAEGLSLFDMAPSRAARDLWQWQPLLDWLNA